MHDLRFLSKLATHHYFVDQERAIFKSLFEGPDHFLSSSAHDIPLFCLNSFCYIYSIRLDLLFVNTFFDSFAVLVVFNKYFLIFSTFYYAFSHILSTVEIFFTIIGAREIIFTAFRKKISVKLFDNFAAVFCFFLLKIFKRPELFYFQRAKPSRYFSLSKKYFLVLCGTIIAVL